MPTLLVVDDDAGIRYALRTLLEDLGCDVVEASEGRAALAALDAQAFDLVLTDLRMPGMGGLALVDALRSQDRSPPAIVITAHGSERVAVDAMKRGALDYFAKPYDADEVARVVTRALRLGQLQQENARLQAGRLLRRFMVFDSPGMYAVAERVARLANRDPTVLILGETGVGKELVARALTQTSSRRDGPFVAVNVATLSDDLAAAELFGHARGAFTGAASTREGLFRAAEGGTLFLDEVGELSPAIQSSLLRVLQERRVRPVGSDREVPVDVRVIAATNRDLAEIPGFRDDLRFRLEVVRIRIPPLRERPTDIPLLVEHFLGRFAERYGLQSATIDATVLQGLVARSWPGNVRELEHVVESMVALSDDGVIDAGVSELAADSPTTTGLRGQVATLERGLITAALERAGGNRSEAARILEISRVSLLDKIRKYGLVSEP